MNSQNFERENRMAKIKSIALSGFRGVRNSLEINLESSKSLLLYGDNGSGKSSISDAFEWFYKDKVEHLSKEEIGTKGIDALRNIFLPEDKAAVVELKFADSRYDASKKLYLKKAKLASESSNSTPDFSQYLNSSLAENLFLRYKDLLRFILATKAQKLEELSQIIGYSEVTKAKSALKKGVNELKKELKLRNFESQISIKQRLLVEQLGQTISNDAQYFSAIKELIAPIGLAVEVKDDKSLDAVLELIKKPEDKDAILNQASYERAIEALSNFGTLTGSILLSYDKFSVKYNAIVNDIEKLNRINLETLLAEGLTVLNKRIIEDDKCPLCLQNKDRETLIDELKRRVEELTLIKKDKDDSEEEQKTTLKLLQSAIAEIDIALKEKATLKAEHTETRKTIEQIKLSLSNSLDSLRKVSLRNRDELSAPNKFLIFDDVMLKKAITEFANEKANISAKGINDIRFTANSKISLTRQAYREMKDLKTEAEKYQKQMQSMELIFTNFIKKQKEGLTAFLKAISKDINELYLYMNEAEKVDEIELIPMGDEEDFEGITIQFKFHGEVVSPPDKYLSESHLNCLGICLFLSSVKTFNKINKFFILDDVISSFDRNHRGRFAHLLKEKFPDYQILLFTHEKDWFDYVANMVKGTNWLIKKTTWNFEQGASIEIPLITVQDRIEAKINKSDTSELGNLIRQYLERLLKEICFALEVKFKFLFNDKNEARMFNELFSELKAKLNERQCTIRTHVVLDRVASSAFLGNVTSHDNEFSEGIEDLKMFYRDVRELESLLRCNTCKKLISKRHYDDVKNQIRCSCGQLNYDWKK